MHDTQHLSNIFRQIALTKPWIDRAQAVLDGLEHEPLMAGLFETPQSPPHHCEGPTVRYHLVRMLSSLYALTDGLIPLHTMEEFARIKGYALEMQEIQQCLMENATTFEVFCLIHDAGKQFRLSIDHNEQMHYHGHEKEIYRSELQNLLSRLAAQFRLASEDQDLLTPLIAIHLLPLARFAHKASAKDIAYLLRFAREHGQDPDAFLLKLKAVMVLDQIFGSEPLPQEIPQSVLPLMNLLAAEREFAPWKIEARERAKELAHKRALQTIFKQVGLDGAQVMEVTQLPPGRTLGALVRSLQLAADGRESIDPDWSIIFVDRIAKARTLIAKL